MRSNKSGIKYMGRSVYFDKDGYPKVKLNNKSKFVHILEWVACNGEVPSNMTVNHMDGNKLNWQIDNLELMSLAENIRHAWRTGLCHARSGESHGRSKLNDLVVMTIRSLPKKAKNGRGYGWSHKELAEKYGVSSKVLREAREGVTWQHLPHP